MEWLLNPWVITAIILSVVVSNIMALKYTANMKFGDKDKIKYLKEKHDREQARLAEEEKAKQANDSSLSDK
ncbi:DUF2897 family protein [Photobacterium swingsii]|uniref:DUF2897 domain-containing protein n=1 Tax=Photobacterium swingsii TaxID=680026 RepID=A0A0J8Y119_9GAMM|nr:DUF2897 family protein [Photobacterium swingsii]KMV31314.1 succinyl-diaminopimelate desuccinylase [Photobacterium swingsii]PSW24036.1 DUF2897 domain-containing protein [Photobacterium swingsii]